MDISKAFQTPKVVFAALARPLAVTALWLLLLDALDPTFELDLRPISSDDVPLYQGAQDFLSTLEIDLKLWHVIAISLAIYVFLFDFLVAVLWRIFPAKVTYSAGDLWMANKTWDAPLRLAMRYGIDPEQVRLEGMATQLDLAENKCRKEFPDTYEQYVGWQVERKRRWLSAYSALSAFLLLTMGLLILDAFLDLPRLQGIGLFRTLLALAAIILVVRIFSENEIERETAARSHFVLECLETDKIDPREEQVLQLAKLEERLYEYFSRTPAPGFPYGNLWLIHYVRLIPGFGRLGRFPWRPLESLKREQYQVAERWRESHHGNDPKAITHPRGVAQRLVARVLGVLVAANVVKNGGPLVGGQVDFPELFRSMRRFRTTGRL